jgi:hypothetical protein
MRQGIGHRASKNTAAVRPDHDAADVSGDERVRRPDYVYVPAGVGEVGALAAVDPAAVDEQRLVGVVERCPLDRLLSEVKLGNAIGEPVEEGGRVRRSASERSTSRSLSGAPRGTVDRLLPQAGGFEGSVQIESQTARPEKRAPDRGPSQHSLCFLL